MLVYDALAMLAGNGKKYIILQKERKMFDWMSNISKVNIICGNISGVGKIDYLYLCCFPLLQQNKKPSTQSKTIFNHQPPRSKQPGRDEK